MKNSGVLKAIAIIVPSIMIVLSIVSTIELSGYQKNVGGYWHNENKQLFFRGTIASLACEVLLSFMIGVILWAVASLLQKNSQSR